MTPNAAIISLYAFAWLSRMHSCVARGQRPLARGPEWFFDTRVQPSFYDGAGKAILHRYWLRMVLPFTVEIPAAIAIFLSGRIWLLNLLIVVMVVLMRVNESAAVRAAERQAEAFAVDDGARTTRIALSLAPRRLRDYTKWKREGAFSAAHIAAAFLLIRYYLGSHADARTVFAGPAFLVYVHAGMLFIKKLIVSRRSAVADADATAQWQAREDSREFFLNAADLGRAILTAALVFEPFKLQTEPSRMNQMVAAWILALVVVALATSLWANRGKKQLLAHELRTRPIRLPDLLGRREIHSGVCYQPDAPMVILKSARGYSLNLASHLAQLGAVYLAGLIVLFAMLPLPK